MKFSNENKDLLAAIDNLYHECDVIVKNKKNDFLKSKYADLLEVVKKIKPHLKKNSLHVLQSPTGDLELHTRITHLPTGQYVEDTFAIKVNSVNPQVVGAIITYQRRYAIVSMLGLVVEDDDDGNSSSKPVESKTDLHLINSTTTLTELRKLWEQHPEWHDQKEYIQAVSIQKNKLDK